jgi:hypothetical protein
MLAAGTASAAKISFSDKGWIDVGGLVQAQYRFEQDAAGSGHDVSNDFLLRRARLIISGQFNDNIGFLVDTDVTYGAATIGGPVGGTAWNNNIYLLDAVATYKFGKEIMLDAGLMLLPFSHNSLTSGAKYATVNNFPSYFAANSQRGTVTWASGSRLPRRPDLLPPGVFNGVQTAAGASGLNPGMLPVRGHDPLQHRRQGGRIRLLPGVLRQ